MFWQRPGWPQIPGVATVISVLLSSCSTDPGEQESDCTPWIVEASDEPLEVTLLEGHWHFEGNALLVGCRHTLDTLTQGERERVAESIVQFVRENGLGVLSRADPEFRLAVVSALNDNLGRSLVTDVWMQFSFSEVDP
jgi:hypothetical protein